MDHLPKDPAILVSSVNMLLRERGYDAMDEYIREEVLLLQGVDYTILEKVTGECASRVYNTLMHQRLEPGTKEAFNGYVACLHQLYLFGAAMQLKRMGYHMTCFQTYTADGLSRFLQNNGIRLWV